MPTEITPYLNSKYEMTDIEYTAALNSVIKTLNRLTKNIKDKEYKRETVLAVAFSPEPLTRDRHIDSTKDHDIILDYKKGITLAMDKNEFPSITDNEFVVGIATNKRTFTFRVYKRYKWNNADIVGIIQIIALCSKDDRRVVLGSCIHDFMLEYKQELFNQFLVQDRTLTIEEYRWITSETFRWIIKSQGMNSLKAKLMSNILDCFQKHLQKKKWIVKVLDGSTD